MSNQIDRLYDIGDLKNQPDRLYDLALQFSMVYQGFCVDDAEIFTVLKKVHDSLWGNLPPVVVIDFRDPDDPLTWGEFGKPPNLPTITR